MKVNSVVGVITLIVVALVVYVLVSGTCNLKCQLPSERFGQDASIRAQSGWIAGPGGMYGHDPIDQFAEQIAEMKAYKRAERGDGVVLGIMEGQHLVDSPTKDIGPETYREGHYPYIIERSCSGQNDCLQGEDCVEGVCILSKSRRENYEPNKGVTKSCNACMSTEDFEME